VIRLGMLRARLVDTDPESGTLALMLVTVLVGLLTTLTAIVVQVSSSNVTNSAFRSEQTQALQAAEGGLNVAIAEINQASSYASFPCSVAQTTVGTVPVTSSYSVAIYYFSVYPPPNPATGALACTPSGNPNLASSPAPESAILVSTGQAGKSPQSAQYLEDELQLGTTQGGTVFDQALFSNTNLTFTSSASVIGYNGDNAKGYANGSFSCANSSHFEGNLTVQGGFTDPSGSSCHIDGNLWTDGSITLAGSSLVGGDVLAAGGSSPSYDSISLSQSATVVGSGSASGSISKLNSSKIEGGTYPNETSLGLPPVESFPEVTYSSSQYTGWTQINESNCGNSGNDTGGIYSDLAAMSTASTQTVIDTSCAISLSGSTTWKLNANLVLFTSGGLTMSGSTQWSSTNATVRDLYIFVPYGVTCSGAPGSPSSGSPGITTNNSAKFDSSIWVLLYTPCTDSFNSSSSLYGQIYGGTITETQSVTDNFELLPTVPGETGGGGTAVDNVSLIFERQLSSATNF